MLMAGRISENGSVCESTISRAGMLSVATTQFPLLHHDRRNHPIHLVSRFGSSVGNARGLPWHLGRQ
jgi:hypothetical protein